MQRHRTIVACLGLMLGLAVADIAFAQVRESDRLLEQYRAARRKELLEELAKLDAAVPPPAAPAPAPAPAATPAPAAPAPAAPPPADAKGQDKAKTDAKAIAAEVVAEQEAKVTQKFGGIEFGVGMSFTGDLGTRDRVTQASLVNGIVRVSDEDNGRARIMLESHYFFTPPGGLFSLRNGEIDKDGNQKRKEWGIGPFLAIQPGTNNIIEAIGGGIMIGLRRDAKTTESFNFCLGIVVDPNTRVLGDGILANQPLPPGETEIRYMEEMQTGFLALVSFSF